MSEEKSKEPAAWWLPLAAVTGIVALAASYAVFRMQYPTADLQTHAAFGGAVAPIAAFLSLFALIAALWSVQVQRAELALQRKELQETRGEMVEQRKQFEKTAAAQEALVSAQNRQALAQRSATVAALQAALVPLRVEWAKLRIVNQEKPFEESIAPIESKLKALLATATREHDEFAERMHEGRLDDD